ncbi:MAG: type I-C CRISPR-associated protein Cas8c/Csd1 [Candidatus Omnitrophica bacterium]|nr:type I-C CRISPR-associated protein Cas8c/Csd1 [Candidatus Omnitrophota bacterium]
MIIQALNELYGRLKDIPDENIPLSGFSREKVQFAFVLSPTGKLLQVNDLRDEKKSAKQLIVPESVKRSVNIEANFLCDSTSYVLGRDNKGKPVRAKETFQACKELHHEIGNGINDAGMKAVLSFLDRWEPEGLEKSLCWPFWEGLSGMKIVFILDGEKRYVHESPEVKRAWLEYRYGRKSEYRAFCLVSGKKSGIARLHKGIKGVFNPGFAEGDIVSFNEKAFCSYGKDQSYNAPVSEEAMFNYTTALNHLLRRESRQKVQIGDATTVFWAEGETPIAGFLKDILDPRETSPDVNWLKIFFEALREGKMPIEEETDGLKFYILGLAPNAKRLSVRFWYVSTVKDIKSRIAQHFTDLGIQREFEDKQLEFPGMWQLLHVTAAQGKTENISPILAGAFMRAIVMGNSYPAGIFTATLERIRAEQYIGYLRASIIKACITRNNRLFKRAKREVGMALDREQKDIGYLLGRLFAVLEKAQKDAIPGANTTIKDRFYGSASATPSVVFPQLMRLAQHHIQKSAYGVNIEKMLGEITADIQAFPTHLALEEQGMFALGYYHQKQDFYKKTE